MTILEHLAELTGFRDRDLLDISVVRAISHVMHPLCVSIHRCIGEPGAQHWLTCARLVQGDDAASADPKWIDIKALPAIEDMPARHYCLLNGEAVTSGDSPCVSIFPIATDREVIGVLELETSEPVPHADWVMVCTFLRIYGNFHDLLDHSERDPLTGLLNRQTFDATFLKRAHHRPAGADIVVPGRRGPSPDTSAWLGVIDIDHFKRVNDTFGHPIGDEVLLLLSRLLRSTFRYQDRLYRFGGEEFVVVLDCLTAEQAGQAFERLRRNIERFVFPQVGRITASLGFTAIGPDEMPAEAFARADKALYHAKETGRNQVVHYADLVRAGLTATAKIAGEVELF